MSTKRKTHKRKKVAGPKPAARPTKRRKVPVNCLGWCGQTFLTADPVGVRFCHPCRAKRDAAPGGAVAVTGRTGRRASSIDS